MLFKITLLSGIATWKINNISYLLKPYFILTYSVFVQFLLFGIENELIEPFGL